MNETLATLVELQGIDTKIIEKRKTIDELPLRINSFQRPIKEAEALLLKEKERYQTLEKKRKEKESLVEDAKERIKKLRQKSADIKSNKEYQAMLKEIETLEKGIYETENELLEIMQETEDIKRAIKEKEQRLSEENATLQREQKKVNEEIAGLEEEIKALKRQRAEIVSRLDEDTYKWYMNTLKNSRGVAVVEAKNEVCKGCNLHIPPQLYVEIKKGLQIHNCPQCRRILYYKSEKIRDNSQAFKSEEKLHTVD